MRSKLSIVVRTRLRGVAGEGNEGYAGVGYIFAGYRLVVVVDVVLIVGLVVAIQEGVVFTVIVVVGFELVTLVDELILFVCQMIVDRVVVVVDSVEISFSNWLTGSSVTKGSEPEPS